MLGLYFVVGYFSVHNPPILTQFVTFRLFCVPFIFCIYGYHLNKCYNITHKKIFGALISISIIVCIYGIIELSSDIFLNKGLTSYLNKGSFYENIKGHGSGAEDPFRYSRFSFLFFKYRMTGILLEPLSTGFLFALSTIVLINIKINQKYRYGYFLIALIIIGMILTQSRSGMLFLLIALSVLLLSSVKAFGLISFIFLVTTGLLFNSEFADFFISSFTNLGGAEHQKGIFDTFENIFNINASLGNGLGVILIHESGYGFILSQLGIFGVLIFICFFLNIIYWQLNNTNKIEKFIIIGSMFSVIAILTFHYYPFSIKGFMFFWLMVGFSFYKKDIKNQYESINS